VVAAVALLVRAIAAVLSDRVVADVLRYRKLAAHVLDVSWNPYLAARLYPYPPVWVWVEVAAEWLARHAGVPFALAVKAPVVLADAVLAGVLVSWGRERDAAPRWAWAYALHPVAILIVGFHGQFDGVALLALVCALRWLRGGRLDRSALALAAGIALKSFPVLVLPFALLFVPRETRARVRYALLATLPVAVLLVPFAIADPGALVRELFAYGGVPDFGWIGAWRAGRGVLGGHLARANAAEFEVLVLVSKMVFLGAAAWLWGGVAWGRLRWGIEESALGVLLAFEVLYGALSAQYLLWPVPLAVLLGERFVLPHAAAATVALVGFYVLLAPGVLTPAGLPLLSPAWSEKLWMAGTAALWLIGAAWTADLVRRGRAAA
jgi:uncharacterized membrane protein